MSNFPYIGGLEIFQELEKTCSNYSKIFVLLDNNTADLCLPTFQKVFKFDFIPITVPAGENSKSLTIASSIWETLLNNGADRKSLLINLGGGMITDLGGYAASSFMRGIDFIQIPTSLLAQIDASVGGKTGINFQGVKNILGAFALPKAVFICNEFLYTLPKRELKSGYAEMLKHALLQGDKLWEDFQKLDFDSTPSIESIKNSVLVKYNVVEEDFLEKGVRQILNLGHTLAHAFESLSLYEDKNPLLHGEAVALGIYYEAILAEKLGILPKSEKEIICQFIAKNYSLKTYNSAQIQAILNYIMHDKKNQSGKISFALLASIGKPVFGIFAEKAIIESCLYENIDF